MMTEISLTCGVGRILLEKKKAASQDFCQWGIQLRSGPALCSVVIRVNTKDGTNHCTWHWIPERLVAQGRKTSTSDSNWIFLLIFHLIHPAFLCWNNTDHSADSHMQSWWDRWRGWEGRKQLWSPWYEKQALPLPVSAHDLHLWGEKGRFAVVRKLTSKGCQQGHIKQAWGQSSQKRNTGEAQRPPVIAG